MNTKMKPVTLENTRDLNGGWNTCRICNSYVNGGFWTKYAHCVRHAWNSVFSVFELVGVCFGMFK